MGKIFRALRLLSRIEIALIETKNIHFELATAAQKGEAFTLTPSQVIWIDKIITEITNKIKR